MKSGYDQFFKRAKNSSHAEMPESSYAAQQATKSKSKKIKIKNKKSFPIKPMSMFFVLLIGLGFSIQYLDQIEEILSSLEISMSSALANQASVEKVDARKPGAQVEVAGKTDEKIANSQEGKVAEDKPAGVEDDPTDYLFKLADRKKQLDKREADLVRREEEIAKLKSTIEAKLVELKSYRDNISVLLQDRVSSDSAKVDTLVQVYSTMKPSQAAKIFETMDEDLVIEILSKMKKKSAADILNLVKSDKAQVLAEKYAGYRLPDRKLSSVNNSASTNSSSLPSSEEDKQQQSTKEESDQ